MSDKREPTERSEDTQAGAGAAPEQTSRIDMDSVRAREDALERAGRTQAQEMMPSAHGRVEEETRRLSERLTREEQERRKALALEQQRQQQAQQVEATALQKLPEAVPIRTTLVALDGGAYAARSLPYATALARLTGCALALGGCAPSGEETPVAETITAVKDIQREPASDRALGEALLTARDRLAAAGFVASAQIIHARNIADGLIALERMVGADALALATHARQGLGRIILGSVADGVMREGHKPALIIPPHAPEATIEQCAFSRALVPFDGSELSEQTLGVIRPFLRGASANSVGSGLRALTLLYIAEDHALERDGEIYLRHMRERLLREATVPVEITAKVSVGSPPGAIVAWASGEGLAGAYNGRHDLIIMSTHGRGGARRMLLGSVASYVLAHSEVPLLLVRPEVES